MKLPFKEQYTLANIDFKSFPTTRYQGSKRKILPWIAETLKDIEFTTVIDAFGGSASVSYLFKKMGKKVTYNDILRFNHIIGKAIIENSSTKLSKDDMAKIVAFENQPSKSHFIRDTFKDIYYLDEENEWLDSMINELSKIQLSEDEKVNEDKINIAFYALFQACIIKRPFNLFHRRNLNLRTNENVVRKFGNKTTWDRTFEFYFRKFAKEANEQIFDNGQQCNSINESVFDIDIENNGWDLIYIDPPYFKKSGKNETTDYTTCYHFLDGLTRYDEWGGMINYETANKRFDKEVYDTGLRKKELKQSFEKLFDKFSGSKIVLSYKYGGIPSIDELIGLMKKFKKNVYTRSKHYKYALNHQNGDKKFNREHLIIGI